MRVQSTIISILALGCLASTAPAQVFAPAIRKPPKMAVAAEPKALIATEDEVGCKDSPLLVRVPGCNILQCSTEAEASVELSIGAAPEGHARTAEVDGASEVIYYLCSAKTATTEIASALEATLLKDRYQVAFSGKDGEDSVVSARKLDQWIQISTYIYDGKPAYVQTALKAAPEEFVSIEDFEEQFPASLRVSLPAMKFASGESDVPPQTEKVLGEIAAFLVKRTDWKFRVDAYASDGPNPAVNLELSKARAAAIAEWFSVHGVEKERVGFAGHGDAMAIPDGDQRIELVKM